LTNRKKYKNYQKGSENYDLPMDKKYEEFLESFKNSDLPFDK